MAKHEGKNFTQLSNLPMDRGDLARLSPSAVKLWIFIKYAENRYTSDQKPGFTMSVREMADLAGMSRSTVWDAKTELEKMGFIRTKRTKYDKRSKSFTRESRLKWTVTYGEKLKGEAKSVESDRPVVEVLDPDEGTFPLAVGSTERQRNVNGKGANSDSPYSGVSQLFDEMLGFNYDKDN